MLNMMRSAGRLISSSSGLSSTDLPFRKCALRLFKDVPCPAWRLICAATVKNWKPPKVFENIEFPERRKLMYLEKAPQPPTGSRPQKMFKRLIDMRGPEPTHHKLIHKQYGIRALHGGTLLAGHIEMIRNTMNRKIDDTRMFAVWRIDAPWKPVTHKGIGHRMGSGKGSIDHYVTPVKGGRIIIEMGGHCEYAEALHILKRIAAKLPFKAEPINQQMLEEEEENERYIRENNLNPFTFDYCMQNNMLGCRKWASPYDYLWNGKYR